ncbi:MAG: transposase [Microcoleus sp. T1-bin1]|nr:transposase [Microcoleus sp. T1-bin1]
MEWTSQEFESGKLIKIPNFPATKKVKLFRVTVSTNGTEYLVTHDLTQQDRIEGRKVCSQRWKVEEFYRELKQLTGIEACQCRKALIQRNHIACAILARNFFKKTARMAGKTVYQLKQKLLSDYLKQELKDPAICCVLV